MKNLKLTAQTICSALLFFCIGLTSPSSFALEQVIIEQDDESTANGHIDYSGSWHRDENTWSDTTGAYVNIRFNGTSIVVNGIKGPDQGIMDVYLDGVFLRSEDNNAPRDRNAFIFSEPKISGGEHILKLVVTGKKAPEGTGTKITIRNVAYTKDDTLVVDAFKMTQIPNSELSIQATSSANDSGIANAFDGDSATHWVANSTENQTIDIDLGHQYLVGKIGMIPDINQLTQGRLRKISLYTSDDGVNYVRSLDDVAFGSNEWTGRQAAINAGFAPSTDQIFYYLHLPEPRRARYLRLAIHSTWNGVARVADFKLYRYIEPAKPYSPKTFKLPIFQQNVYGDISHGQKVLIEKGLQVQAWIPIEGSGRRELSREDFDRLNITGVANYSQRSLYPENFLSRNPDLLWSAAKFPFGNSKLTALPPTTGDSPLIPQALIDNLSKGVSICLGDEQEYGDLIQRRNTLAWFEYARSHFPDQIIHTNQVEGQFRSIADWEHYMTNAEPDMLTYDYYVYSSSGRDEDVPYLALKNMNGPRKYASLGVDLTGNKPIPFGLYLGAYKTGGNSYAEGWYEFTESQKKFIPFIAMAAGAKWFSLFRVEYDKYGSFLFGEDGWPTHHFFEYANIFKQMRNLGPHLVRLQNIDLAVVSGQTLELTDGVKNIVDNDLPGRFNNGYFQFGDWSRDRNPSYHIESVTVVNPETVNNGLAQDVFIGYFDLLPNLSEQQLSFFSSQAPKYFMVVNGQTSGNGRTFKAQFGSSKETKQNIRLVFSQSGTLKKVNKNTGASETVPLIAIDGGYELNLSIGGGDGELFFWQE
ncbi:discoidin domain-containing protein [Pelagibaculum spongiae]|nr:discoidin domain-containing protein [Pelagibaculum spongiae]